MRHKLEIYCASATVGAAVMLLICATEASAAGAAAKADTARERAQVLKALVDCRALSDNAARLACYDKAAAEIDKAEAGGEIVVVDRQQARAARRQAFGFDLSALSIFDRSATKEELNVIDAKVRSATHGPDGRWVITLEDGAVWREVGDIEPNLDPRPGALAHISRGTVGSYFIKISGVSTHVRRAQ